MNEDVEAARAAVAARLPAEVQGRGHVAVDLPDLDGRARGEEDVGGAVAVEVREREGRDGRDAPVRARVRRDEALGRVVDDGEAVRARRDDVERPVAVHVRDAQDAALDAGAELRVGEAGARQRPGRGDPQREAAAAQPGKSRGFSIQMLPAIAAWGLSEAKMQSLTAFCPHL